MTLSCEVFIQRRIDKVGFINSEQSGITEGPATFMKHLFYYSIDFSIYTQEWNKPRLSMRYHILYSNVRRKDEVKKQEVELLQESLL